MDDWRSLPPTAKKRFLERLRATPKRSTDDASARTLPPWPGWLRDYAPQTFTGSFASFHEEFWDWYWAITQKRLSGESLSDEESVFLAIWSRGQGKSSNVEWAAIVEGALFGSGYVLYVSGTQALADGHVASIRERIESERLARDYPHIGNPMIGKFGNQHGWRQDFLRAEGGWAIRPIGLDVGVRGGRVGETRPTLIILDDVDDFSDSPAVVEKKLHAITRSIIPAGGKGTVILGAQNLIHRNSVFNQILTRKTSALGRRIVSGPFPAFEDLEIELQSTDDGPRNVITGGRPTWSDMDLEACQKFLDDSGREAFLAEYQHDFSLIEEVRVIPEYDERLHVITWSDFAKVYGARHIPQHWKREVGFDAGFTEGHLSAWTWVATSSENSAFPGLRFRYRGMTFVSPLVDDMAEAAKKAMGPDAAARRYFDETQFVQRWVMSHEAKSTRDTLLVKHGLMFVPGKFGKTDGIDQWRHFLRVDKKKPHPFKPDEQLPDGSWRLGRPSFFDVVADDQLFSPRDDAGLKTHREQVLAWRWRPAKLTASGLQIEQPVKAFEDTCFVAGTSVETLLGSIPIEDVRAGDWILTRRGYRRCLASGMTSAAAAVVEMSFSNGSRLLVTDNHPIWTEGRGFIPCREIEIDTEMRSWRNTKLSRLTAFAFTAIRSQNTGRSGFIITLISTLLDRASKRCTWRSGKRLMGLFRRATTFITRTEILSTTRSRTWNAYPAPTTTGCTPRNGLPRSAPSSRRDWTHIASGPPSGTEATKAGPGIASTRKSPSCFVRFVTSFAAIAGRLFNRELPRRNSAPRCANSESGKAFLLKRLSDSVRTAAGHILRAPDLERFIVPARVQARRHIGARLPVYNLSVEGCPEFFANGILVHNCDSTRFITAEWGPAPAPLTLDEKIARQVEAELGPRDQRPRDPLALSPTDGRNFGRLMREAEIRKELEQEEVGEFGSFWRGLS
jgi:hypothetical protein